jgi:hypothetical protein
METYAREQFKQMCHPLKMPLFYFTWTHVNSKSLSCLSRVNTRSIWEARWLYYQRSLGRTVLSILMAINNCRLHMCGHGDFAPGHICYLYLDRSGTLKCVLFPLFCWAYEMLYREIHAACTQGQQIINVNCKLSLTMSFTQLHSRHII